MIILNDYSKQADKKVVNRDQGVPLSPVPLQINGICLVVC
jgi:hypothetical protein